MIWGNKIKTEVNYYSSTTILKAKPKYSKIKVSHLILIRNSSNWYQLIIYFYRLLNAQN